VADGANRLLAGNLLIRAALSGLQEEHEMQKISFGLFTGAAILGATALVYAQSATPIEGNPSVVRPAPPSGTVMTSPPSTTGAAPNSAAPKSDGAAHMPGGNPDRAPGSS
jgi:hypothetical protein